MSRTKLTLMILGVGLVSALAAGGIGAGLATALVTQFQNNSRSSPSDVADRVEHALESETLGELRPYTVYLPDFYARDTDQTYPVLVVLDGSDRGTEAAQVTRAFDRADLAPGHLVVSVDNVPRGRSQDLLPPMGEEVDGTTGGADAFLRFIETELLPDVDSLYRTDDTRLLAGHSFGGLFAAHALTERPGLFDGVLALSPSFWVADGTSADRIDSLAASGSPPDVFLYLAIGDETGPMRTRFDALVASLGDRDTSPFRWRSDVIEGSSHGAVPRLALPMALREFWMGETASQP
ncbi:MAG: alpha/beta hydrolase-fold protein [Bacteroidota bacterium]